jgi:hypothetical protein
MHNIGKQNAPASLNTGNLVHVFDGTSIEKVASLHPRRVLCRVNTCLLLRLLAQLHELHIVDHDLYLSQEKFKKMYSEVGVMQSVFSRELHLVTLLEANLRLAMLKAHAY